MANITVIGCGQMGSAISFPAAYNGHKIRLVGTHLDEEIVKQGKETGIHKTLCKTTPEGKVGFKMPENDTFHYLDEFEGLLKDTDLLICGVSSFGIDWFCEKIIPLIPEDMPVLSITKGMIHTGDGKMISYPELFEETAAKLGKKISFNAVGGPCTSYELADNDPTEVTFCGRNEEQLRWLKSLFETPVYHVSLSTDVRGVECAVALKNAYALGVSLAVGLSYAREGKEIMHFNSQAALFQQSAREMSSLLEIVGCAPDNIYLGIGDLYVTIYGGRTRMIGTLLGEGMSFDAAMERLKGVTLESIVISGRTCDCIRKRVELGLSKAEDYPLLMHIGDLITSKASVNIPWADFEREFNDNLR